MLLQSLKEYADTRMKDIPPPLYNESPVRYIIELDGEGKLLNREPTDTADPGSPSTRRGVRRLVPQVARSVGIKPLLLADKADYTLGYEGEGSRPERVAACHKAYMDTLERCATSTGETSVQAAYTFLGGDPLAQLDLGEKFDPGGLITFNVDGYYPTALPAVQDFWAAENTDSDAPIMQCIVCGQKRPVLERLQGKIKGVPGGQTSGTSIISANAEAFESYGLEASLIAPTCAACGERFTKAANELLASERNRIRLGNAAFISWTREDVPFSFTDYMDNPKPEQVNELLSTVRSGKPMPIVDDTAFYATVFSGSGGRTVVRDWIDTTVGEVKTHLARWFEMQCIVDPYGEEHRPLGLYGLAAATVREARDLAPPTPSELLRAALTGTPLPSDLLYQAVRRNRVEQSITRQRAALIKLVLLSQQRDDKPPGVGPHQQDQTQYRRDQTRKEDKMVQLDQSNTDPAYRCGRLLAVLEATQKLAVPGAKATIVDRFFGTASSAPASVFGRLLRGSQAHLGKLERDRPGAHVALQRRLEEIMSGLKGFPRTLTLEEQGLFSLGYYHQRAFDRAQAKAAVERRKGVAVPGVADEDAEQELTTALNDGEVADRTE